MRKREDKVLSVAAWTLWSYIKKEKELAEETVFNLSHSGRWVMCAFSDVTGAKVGCDQENTEKIREGLANRFI